MQNYHDWKSTTMRRYAISALSLAWCLASGCMMNKGSFDPTQLPQRSAGYEFGKTSPRVSSGDSTESGSGVSNVPVFDADKYHEPNAESKTADKDAVNLQIRGQWSADAQPPTTAARPSDPYAINSGRSYATRPTNSPSAFDTGGYPSTGQGFAAQQTGYQDFSGNTNSYADTTNRYAAGSNEFTRGSMIPSGQPKQGFRLAQQVPYQPQGPVRHVPGPYTPGTPPSAQAPLPPPGELSPTLPGTIEQQPLTVLPDGATADIDVIVRETQTGRFMFGVGVNSDLGVTGQVVIDERNFDIRQIPTSFNDFVNGTAFRGASQGFRMEAMPGSQVQRYLVSFSDPYLLNGRLPFSLNVSGFFYDRQFFDWDEQRLGGRVALGYRLNHDLSVSAALRGERVTIHDPRVAGVEELDSALGDSTLFSGRVALTHDTRDVPFAATEGHLIELSYEQVFGSYDYPRAEIDYRKYFLVRERPDGSGRHTLSYSFRFGFSGGQTPIFENYFAGGYSTMRGFDFRGASPTVNGVQVGGEFRMLGSVEYMFPLTADDMIKGVAFCDFGTVEENIEINADNYRVSPGLGLRISIPAMGPAPLALDFAVPVAHADTDEIENFSFFFGFGR